ncbi:MAG TPA: glycosyltransferase family 39 protein, partial [Lacunisphaera sp.]|nr:glycosyltransferase family 39 protein [Lacunisphaera sp.]
MSEIRSPDRVESIIATVCLGLVLLFHGWGASVGWNSQSLPGCEFRQTQTALSAHFILREKNYSLAYPTPVLGKPWSIPMEFPLYQWTVAKVTELSGWPLTQVGRGVSLVCFYLTLPALYGLARCLGLPRARALLVLSFIVICPLYIFYARAFLIETMAWMFGSWFLLGYVMSAGQRRPAWLVVAAAGGVGAGLVKVTTLIAFLLP